MNVTPVECVEHVTPTAKDFQRHSGLTLTFNYASAQDQVDSNLLIFLHGLGDTAQPFFQLGKQLQKTLPQTAIMSIQAPLRVPLLEEEAWMWWESFDSLGELIQNPHPGKAIDLLRALLTYLTSPDTQGGCNWDPKNIHLFGFAQGGSLLLETLIQMRPREWGSATSVCGPLLSLPTFSPALTTPLCYVTRFQKALLASARARTSITAVQRAFVHTTHYNFTDTQQEMVHGSEWKNIISFWSRFWSQKSSWERDGELYRVS